MEEGVDSKDLRERLRWLVSLRWIGILSVFVTTHVVRELSALSFSLIPVYAILGFAALYNLFFSWSLRFPNHDARKIAVAQIFLDQFTLALAMYFSGGCDSPFIYFFIFHIVISGILLPWGYTLVFAFLAVLFPMAVMGLKHYGILPHFGIFKDEPMLFTNLTVVASYGVAFVATIFLTAYFVTYLSRRLHEKNEEIRRLYALSERLRSSIRIAEVISIIERELCGFTGINRSRYIPLDKSRRVLTVSSPEKELNIPLVDRNSLTESLLRGAPMAIDYRTIASDYEKEVMDLMGAKKVLLLPVLAASLSSCYRYFQCSDTKCPVYGDEAGKCWQVSATHCRGRIFRNNVEKLDSCLSCELFTPVGLYALNVTAEYTPFEKVDMEACMRLLDAAGLAVSNALLYEKTLGLSKIDGLTGLKNHREFKEAFAAECLRAKRYQRGLGMMMLDVDHFKNYNDTHGHPQGDILLKKLAELIGENLKDTDVVARYGGEEFAVLLFETTKQEAVNVAERLRHMVEWCKFPKEETQPGGKITVSVGVSGYPDDGDNMETLLSAADAALYRAKRAGRNRVIAAGDNAP
jgi:diguanylate cyclase (GGDEF)-like protein